MASTEEGGGNAVGKEPEPPETNKTPAAQEAETPEAEPVKGEVPAQEAHEPAADAPEAEKAPRGETPEEAEPEPAPDQPGIDEPAAPPRRAWVWVAVVLVGAAAIGLVIGALLGGRQGGPLANQPGGNGRPTIVVGTVAAAPSAIANVPSPSPSTAVAGATAGAAAAHQYVVQPGDTLRSIAQDQYGDATQWPKIYQANRDQIGDNPDALVAGQTLQIPPP